MLIAIAFAIGLVVASVLIHYEALRLTSDFIPRLVIRPQQRILVVLAAIMFVHVSVIGLFAASYYMLSAKLGVGSMHGEFQGSALDFFYYSASTYTTLGIGDVYAQGPMRIVSGIQSLTGLVMISWSASFTYLHMERFWEAHHK
ncbi:MAG: potassium channel family protein [Beijerinckiaceae bacterium]|nr:potassium channel family protein [Beijerinckiaceae bacterium]